MARFVRGNHSYGDIDIIGRGKILVQVGKYCSIAPEVKAIINGHRTDWITTYPLPLFPRDFPKCRGDKSRVTSGKVNIGNDVWIGYGVALIAPISIGDGAIIGAGSVITKHINPYEIWAGNPARMIRKRFTDEQIGKLLGIRWWDWDDEKVDANSRLLCSGDIEQLIQQEAHNV